jgi:hypothetical protein
MTPDERTQLIERYAEGAQALRDAWASAPEEMHTWRPAPDAWSVHEIICHCADSEMGGALRIRMLAAEPDPQLIGYDQDVWAITFDYHNRSTDLAFGVIDTVRGWTAALLPTLTEEQWEKAGTHSESGAYSATDWLRTYGNHLHEHVDQINANIDAWTNQSQAGKSNP